MNRMLGEMGVVEVGSTNSFGILGVYLTVACHSYC